MRDAFVDVPLLSPCKVVFTVPRDCRIDSPEKPLGCFRKGDRVELAFDTRRTWFRFWGLSAAEIQPDSAGVRTLEKAAAQWRAFPENAPAELVKVHVVDDAFFRSVVPAEERLLLDVDCFGNSVFGEKSRAYPFDRVVYAASKKLTAKEYSDGGISFGKGKSFWVHPRGFSFKIEGIDQLGLSSDAVLRVRLSTVVEADEPLSYCISAVSGWKRLFGFFQSKEKQQKVVWNPPKIRTKEGLFIFDVKVSDIEDGTVAVGLRTNQKQILDNWYADGGFIARLERVIVTEVVR